MQPALAGDQILPTDSSLSTCTDKQKYLETFTVIVVISEISPELKLTLCIKHYELYFLYKKKKKKIENLKKKCRLNKSLKY